MKAKQTNMHTIQDSPPRSYTQNKPTQIPTTNCTNNTTPATSLPAIAPLAFVVADGEAEEEPEPEAVVAGVEVELAEEVVELLELLVDDVAEVEVIELLEVLVKVLTVSLEETTTAALEVDVTVTTVPVGETTTTVVEVAAPEPRTAPPGAS